ncbi:MAG: thiamine-phosphate kinase [Alphaproteobacteria bacterium]|jgi:thiamine-monophosphate kinase|nr:thiamine-phosphate kinase [Alphaproteobacteria bacterium]MDP6515479.1 thiamine-phosphate kinase [Alphaproteobacteria bacterium]
MTQRPGEFDLIARYLAPLAAGFAGAFQLTDDAAAIDLPPSHRLIATADALVSGVHFRAGDSPEDIAAKALRVNLSDLAAMGAAPRAYLLTLALPDTIDEDWIARFTAALAEDQGRFGIALAGGDTVATPGPLTLSVTALGTVPDGGEVRRSGARAGDRVFVSGTIGDAALGLRCLDGELPGAGVEERQWLARRYRRPEPRVALGQRLIGVASAAIDISDGLIADLGHICAASRTGATIRADAVPLSDAARRVIGADPQLLAPALTGGDDYELAFTAPADRGKRIGAIGTALGLPITPIGEIDAQPGLRVHDSAGNPFPLTETGYRHF